MADGENAPGPPSAPYWKWNADDTVLALSEPHPQPLRLIEGLPTKLQCVSTGTLSEDSELPHRLPVEYTVGRFDVICWPRGVRECDTEWHTGNERFQWIIRMRMVRYQNATTRLEKINIVKDATDAVRGAGGRFVRFVSTISSPINTFTTSATQIPSLNFSNRQLCQEISGNWIDIGLKKAREKVNHGLRHATERQQSTTHKRRSASATSLSRAANPPKRVFARGSLSSSGSSSSTNTSSLKAPFLQKSTSTPDRMDSVPTTTLSLSTFPATAPASASEMLLRDDSSADTTMDGMLYCNYNMDKVNSWDTFEPNE